MANEPIAKTFTIDAVSGVIRYKGEGEFVGWISGSYDFRTRIHHVHVQRIMDSDILVEDVEVSIE